MTTECREMSYVVDKYVALFISFAWFTPGSPVSQEQSAALLIGQYLFGIVSRSILIGLKVHKLSQVKYAKFEIITKFEIRNRTQRKAANPENGAKLSRIRRISESSQT